MKGENLFKNIYIGLMVLLFSLIISTPIVVHTQISFFAEEIKETIEAVTLFILVTISVVIYSFYKKRLDRREKELTETLNYIGAVNLQISQINSIFDVVAKYPESKKDFKFLFESLAQRALAGVSSDWVLFRIIDVVSGKTLTEYTKARGNAVLLKYEISNKELIEGKELQGCRVVASTQENLDIKTFGIMPVKSLSDNQEILIRAIVNNLSMLYLIFELNIAKNHNN